MALAGRMIWIISGTLFLGAAFLMPTTVSTGFGGYEGGLIGRALPSEVVNIPRLATKLLLCLFFAAAFVAGVVLDVGGLVIEAVRDDGGRPAVPPLLERDAAGNADPHHLAELGIVRDEAGWTYDGVPMADWRATITRAVDEGRLRLS